MVSPFHENLPQRHMDFEWALAAAHNVELQAPTRPWLLEHMLPAASCGRLCLLFSHPTQGSLLQGMPFSVHLTSTHSQHEEAMKRGGQ